MNALKYPFLILKSVRPRQWMKNLALFASLFFSQFFFYIPPGGIPYFVTVLYASIVFSLVTSAIYLINDIVDRDADAKHPFKRKRSIASGELPIRVASLVVVLLLLIASIGSIQLGGFFQLILLTYIGIQVLYSKWLKHVPILDISVIATGFLLRIYAGAVVVELHMSVWFLLTVISASLFLAVGKRQSERTLLMGYAEGIGSTRKILKSYSNRLLDQYTSMFATATWVTYALFTFQNPIDGNNELAGYYSMLPRTLRSEKLLMLTIPLVIFGVMRYLQLIYEQNKGESPERVLLGDKPLLATVFIFVLMAFLVLYGI